MNFVIIVSTGDKLRTIHPDAFGNKKSLLIAAVEKVLEQRIATEQGILDRAKEADLRAAERPIPDSDPTLVRREIAHAQGFTGDACDNCQQFKMQRTGHCLTCAACGTTSGCS